MHAKEEGGDESEFHGHSDWENIYTTPSGYVIRAVLSPIEDTYVYDDRGIGEDNFPNRPSTHLVKSWYFVADTPGNDRGDSRMRVVLHPIRVQIGQRVTVPAVPCTP